MLQISRLFRYPIKSCAREEVQTLGLSAKGVLGDREFVILNERDEVVSQRSNKEFGICEVLSMCHIAPALTPNRLVLTAPDMHQVDVSRTKTIWSPIYVSVFGFRGPVVEVSRLTSEWCTEFLSRERPSEYRLMRIASDWQRPGKTGTAGFALADGDPILMISEASLEHLNMRLERKGGSKVGFDRFRPNMVITGCGIHEEDTFERVQVDKCITLIGRKLNVRCPFIQVDQQTGKRSAEPYRTLLEYRQSPYEDRKPNDIVFGKKFGYDGVGEIGVGSVITPLTYSMMSFS
jgi:uncharacterized protein YcbX